MIVLARSMITAYFFFTLGSLLAAATSRGRFIDAFVFHQMLVVAFLGVILLLHVIVALWRICTGGAWDETGEFSWELAIEIGSGSDGDGGDGGDGGGGE